MGATKRIISLSSILIFRSPKRFLSISIPSTNRVFQGFRPICSSTIFTTTAAAVELESQGPPPASDKHSIRHHKDSRGIALNSPQQLNPPKPSKVLGKSDETRILDSDFEELGLSEEVLAALHEMGILAPTEIQSIGIPAVLQGKSVVLCSHTGSGKTLAYLLPIIQLLRRDELELDIQMKARCPRAIILCPTKELSEQVFHEAKRIRSTMELPQEDSLNISMVVGAPHQILQHIENGDLVCDDIQYLVFDEADTLFDHGFGPDIYKFLDLLKHRASKPNDPGFQTVLVAATVTTAMQKLINEEQGISNLKICVCGVISDIGTCNVLIGELCKSNELDKALSLYSDMKSNGISPNADILTNLISSTSEQQMLQLFEDSQDIQEIESFLTLYDSVLSSLMKNELIDKAYTLLRLITEKLFDVEGVIWSKFTFVHTVMAGLCKYGKLEAALDLLKDLDKLPFTKDVTLYNDLIYALSNSNRVDDCFELLNEMKLHQLQPTHFTYNSIYLYYCRKSDTAGSLELVKEMRCFGHSPWIKHTTLLMKNLCNKGRALEAVDYLSEIVKSGARPDIVPFSVALEGLIKLQMLDQALDLFKEMCSHGKIPDVIAYNILIKGFCKAKRMSEAEDVFKELLGNGLLPSVITYNSLIDGYCKNGNIEKALLLLSSMNTELPNVVTYTTLIDGLFNGGLIDDAISLWGEMEMKGCKPNRISFMALINGLCKNGRPSEALSFLREMNERGFHADGFIYIALLTGFILKGNACSAYDVLKEMIDKEIVLKPEDKNHSVLEDAVLKLYLDPSTSLNVHSLIASGAILTISVDELQERSQLVT